MFESSKLHCRLHCLGVEVTNGYRGHVFRLGPCFFLSISQTQLLRMCLFPCEAYDSRKGGQTHHPKKKWKEKNHEHKPTIPCQTTTCDTMKLRSTPQSEDALMIMSLIVSSPQIENSYPNSYPPLHMARTWMDMHRLRRLHDSQYIMKKPFTNENSNLSNIFHNNIHRKKVESLKVRSTEEFLCQFAWLPCRFFRGRRQGRQPLNN